MTDERSAKTRRRLLGAAERLVAREGAAKLTLEAVAREAGMSKGSLLYHFPTKDALVAGMVGDLIGSFELSVGERLVEEGDDVPGAWARAYAGATFVPEGDRQRDLDLSAGLLAAVAGDPALLEPLRESYAGWQERLERDGIDPALATLVRLAADGLWMAELFGMAPPTGELREGVFRRLISLTREGGGPDDGSAKEE